MLFHYLINIASSSQLTDRLEKTFYKNNSFATSCLIMSSSVDLFFALSNILKQNFGEKYSFARYYFLVSLRTKFSFELSNKFQQHFGMNFCFAMYYFIMSTSGKISFEPRIYLNGTFLRIIYLKYRIWSSHHSKNFISDWTIYSNRIYSELFISYVLFQDVLPFKPLFEVEQYNRTSLWWALFVCHVFVHYAST